MGLKEDMLQLFQKKHQTLCREAYILLIHNSLVGVLVPFFILNYISELLNEYLPKLL